MRRVEIQYESFIHFTTSYAPPNTSESEINTQQLGLMGGLYVPEPRSVVGFGQPAGQSQGSTT